ncbi:MAG: XRE family transcriptional regulator [Pseudonocardiaceae bacterium]
MACDDARSSSRTSLAERLNELFATVTYVDAHGRRREYSTPYVADAITADHSHDTHLSRVYLATLRGGTNTNPTLGMLHAIAKFFNDHRPEGMTSITASRLLPEEETREAQELRRKLDDADVRVIASRAGDMDPTARQQLLRIIDALDTPPTRS